MGASAARLNVVPSSDELIAPLARPSGRKVRPSMSAISASKDAGPKSTYSTMGPPSTTLFTSVVVLSCRPRISSISTSLPTLAEGTVGGGGGGGGGGPWITTKSEKLVTSPLTLPVPNVAPAICSHWPWAFVL